MPLVEYVPDPRRYEDIFANQVGYGPIVRYQGSNLQNGSGFFPQLLKNLFAKIANFAKPFVTAATPHVKSAFEAAKPHLRDAASGAVKEATSRVTDALARNLAPQQEGSGIRKKKRYAKKTTTVKRIRRIPPIDIPDFF
jgi:hypothetical protein